jgi:hypothetical protein
MGCLIAAAIYAAWMVLALTWQLFKLLVWIAFYLVGAILNIIFSSRR